MPPRRNYLLGYGERLAEPVTVSGGGGPKTPPYSLAESVERLGRMSSELAVSLRGLPALAMPEGQAVLSLTLHPEYYAKSYFPSALLSDLGLRTVGSRSKTVTPERRSKGRTPEPAVTTELLLAGQVGAIEGIPSRLETYDRNEASARQLAAVELLEAPDPIQELKLEPGANEPMLLEVAIHAGQSPRDAFILDGFSQFLRSLGIEGDFDRRFFAGRLCFLRVLAAPGRAAEVAKFSFLRVIRPMPQLRMTTPMLRVTSPLFEVQSAS